MSATTGFSLKLMGAQLAAEAKPLQEQRVIEERYRPTARAMYHVASLQLKNWRPDPAGTVQRKLG